MTFITAFAVAFLLLLGHPGGVSSCSPGYYCPTGITRFDGGANVCDDVEQCGTTSSLGVTVTCGGSNCSWQNLGSPYGKCTGTFPYCSREWSGTSCCILDDNGGGWGRRESLLHRDRERTSFGGRRPGEYRIHRQLDGNGRNDPVSYSKLSPASRPRRF